MHQVILFVSVIIIALVSQGYFCVEIIDGRDVKKTGSYMASIQFQNKHECGATLIHRQWILTTANCIVHLSKLHKGEKSVILGTLSLKNNKTRQEFTAIAEKRENYNQKTEENNLALLKLDRPVKLNKFVSILSLPKSTKDIKPETKCIVQGWGQDSVDDDESSDTLKETTVRIIDRTTCNSKNYYNRNPVITDDMICAGDKTGKNSVCVGDAGDALLCKTKRFGKPVFSGVASFGKGCAVDKKPGIYMLLSSKHVTWIKKSIKGTNYNTTMKQN
uniref:Granzyme K-like n=1 Tax=Callorhinchus milii TaxID=7868 RepID=A0A4W3K980_CALMI|eukprot:gi/632949830/ref/XP_007890378.1/ PREDICTED: granzyme K-like [Callorhinchus milii]